MIEVPQDGGWTIAGAVMGHVQNVLLYGPPGTGKSTFACRHGSPSWYRVYMHEDASEADLLGRERLTGVGGATSTVWTPGPALRAWTEGKRLVIDEIDKASGPALTMLLAFLEDTATAALTIPATGETVTPLAGFHVVATMNGTPDELPDALKDRFTVRILIDRPHPNAIATLPTDLQKAAYETAKLPEARRISIRGWQAFARLRSQLRDETMAALAVFGSTRAEPILDALKIAREGGKPSF